MEIPANRAHIEFALEDTPYPVIAFSGEARLNQCFHFQIDSTSGDPEEKWHLGKK